MSTIAAVAKPLSPAVPDSTGMPSSRGQRARMTQTQAKASPAPTNGSNVSSGRSGRSRISRSHSTNLASPDKAGSASVPLPLKHSPEGSAASGTSARNSPQRRPVKIRIVGTRSRASQLPAGPVRLNNGEYDGPGEYSSYPSDPSDIGVSEDEEPEVIPAKKNRRFRFPGDGHSPSPPPSSTSVPPPTVKTEASTSTSTPRIKLITVPRPRSRSPSAAASSTPAPLANGADTPSPIAVVVDDEPIDVEIVPAPTPAVDDDQSSEAVVALEPDVDEAAKVPDLPRRAPRKKRKWLKKGEVDPDDPVAVARQKERHAIIDEAIANLDAQEASVRSGEHPQLVLMWKELERRRYLQLAQLQERLWAQKADLVKMYDHDESQAWANWDEIKDELVTSLTLDSWRKVSQLHAEHIALKRLPNSMPSTRDGVGSGGWQLPRAILSNGKLETAVVCNAEGQLRRRKALPSQPDQISHTELTDDLRALGIKGEITGRPDHIAPPKTRLTRAQEEKKAESRKRTRAFSPPPPAPRPSVTVDRYKTIGDAFNETVGAYEPLPLDQFGKPNSVENPYEGQPCPNPKLAPAVKDDAADGKVKVEAKPSPAASTAKK